MDLSALQELCLEGNPVAEDVFFRSKVLSSLTLPCLKSIDGAPVKSRLSGQLKYSDMRMRVGIRPLQSSHRGSFDESRCSSASSSVNQSAASFHRSDSDDGSIRPLPPSAARPPSGEHSYSELLVDPLQFATQLVNSTSSGQQLSGQQQQQQLSMMMMTTRTRDDDDDDDDDDDAGHSPPLCEHRPEEPSSITDQSSLVGDHLHLDDLQDYQHYLQLSTLPWRRPPSIRPNYSGGVFKYSKTMGSPNPSKGSGAPSLSPMKMGARINPPNPNPPYSAQKTRRTNDAAAPVSSPAVRLEAAPTTSPAVRLEAAPATSPSQQQQETAANPNEWMAPILKEGWHGRKGSSSLDGLALPLPLPPTASPDHRQLASRSISHNAESMLRISASKVQRTVKGPAASASNSPTRSSLIRSSFISTVVRSKQEMENIEQALINDRRTTINDRRATINDRRATYISPQKQSSSNLWPAPRGGTVVGRSTIVDAYSQNKSTAQHLIDSQEYRHQDSASISQEYRHQDSASISQEYRQQGSRVSDEPPIGGELAESPYRRFLTLRERLTNKLITSSDERLTNNCITSTDALDQFPKQDEFSAGYSESKSGAALGIDLPLSSHEAAHHSTYGFARMLTPDDVDAIFSDDQLGSTGSTAAKRELVTELKKIESKVDSLSLQDRLLLVGNQLGSAAVQAEDTHTLTSNSNSEVNGYGLLYSMIQQRKTILDSISTNAPPRVITSSDATTAPHPTDDSAAASIAKDTGTAVSTRTIFDAIGKLKERQLASFKVLYGAAPLVTDDPWSLGSRSTEAHTVQHLVQPSLPPQGSSQSAGSSSFLNRFVENNPYIRLQQQQGQAQGQQRPLYRSEQQAVVSDSRQLVWASNGYHL